MDLEPAQESRWGNPDREGGRGRPLVAVLTGPSSAPPAGRRRCTSPARTVSWKTASHQRLHRRGRSACASASGLPSTPYCPSDLAQLSSSLLCCPLLIPTLWLPGTQVGDTVGVVYVPAPNTMKVLKTRDRLESYPSQGIFGGMRVI